MSDGNGPEVERLGVLLEDAAVVITAGILDTGDPIGLGLDAPAAPVPIDRPLSLSNEDGEIP